MCILEKISIFRSVEIPRQLHNYVVPVKHSLRVQVKGPGKNSLLGIIFEDLELS